MLVVHVVATTSGVCHRVASSWLLCGRLGRSRHLHVVGTGDFASWPSSLSSNRCACSRQRPAACALCEKETVEWLASEAPAAMAPPQSSEGKGVPQALLAGEVGKIVSELQARMASYFGQFGHLIGNTGAWSRSCSAVTAAAPEASGGARRAARIMHACAAAGELAVAVVLGTVDATINEQGGVLAKRETAEQVRARARCMPNAGMQPRALCACMQPRALCACLLAAAAVPPPLVPNCRCSCHCRCRCQQDMMALLSASLQARLTHLASLTAGCDDDAARRHVASALQLELERLAAVPFGVPLLHAIGCVKASARAAWHALTNARATAHVRLLPTSLCPSACCRRAYCRAAETAQGNLLVQGVKNLADTVSHKVHCDAQRMGTCRVTQQRIEPTLAHEHALHSHARRPGRVLGCSRQGRASRSSVMATASSTRLCRCRRRRAWSAWRS